MKTTSFLSAYKEGLEAENYVRDMLRSWNLEVEEAPDTWFQPWDLRVNGKTIEVKLDLMASKTGNLALELEALDHSQADLLAIVVKPPITIYFKELAPVRELAHQWHKKVRGGEYGRLLSLIPRSIFLDRMKPTILSVNPN